MSVSYIRMRQGDTERACKIYSTDCYGGTDISYRSHEVSFVRLESTFSEQRCKELDEHHENWQNVDVCFSLIGH